MITLKLPQNIAVTGSTRSGKTKLTTTLLQTQLLPQLDCLIILSPTIELSGDFNEFEPNDNPSKGKLVYKFSKDFKTVIDQVVEQQESIIKQDGLKCSQSIAIILDDMVNHPLLRFRGLIDGLSTKSRHLNISLIVLVQRITALPRTFRLNTQTFIAFNVVNYSELERLLEDCVPKRLRNPLRNHITDIYNEPYNFLLINCFSTRIKDRLMLNGKEYLYDRLIGSTNKH